MPVSFSILENRCSSSRARWRIIIIGAPPSGGKCPNLLAETLGILEHLDIDSGEFFSTALLPDVTKLLGKPEGEPPLAVRLGRKRLEKEGWP
jgi:hypothetical protein